jgi:hypothetical protein
MKSVLGEMVGEKSEEVSIGTKFGKIMYWVHESSVRQGRDR